MKKIIFTALLALSALFVANEADAKSYVMEMGQYGYIQKDKPSNAEHYYLMKADGTANNVKSVCGNGASYRYVGNKLSQQLMYDVVIQSSSVKSLRSYIGDDSYICEVGYEQQTIKFKKGQFGFAWGFGEFGGKTEYYAFKFDGTKLVNVADPTKTLPARVGMQLGQTYSVRYTNGTLHTVQVATLNIPEILKLSQ